MAIIYMGVVTTFENNRSSKGVKLRVKEPSRRLPSSRWRTMNVFDDDEDEA
jgi:hypothetical protein